ncbi:MAG: DNA-binding protein [Saprospiraceae bacterium]|nr:DNA-binding protein [Saprospiraceae bacterium]MBK7812389.1 DNA-binding protein [Saprospiraceae bacterium]MBK9632387.1 DNA-binding protein [Saprospiraceae bacterium]
MYITLEELRDIKHRLPSGSIKKIADDLKVDEQIVRNYFGANHLENSGNHLQAGPNGGIVLIDDETILNKARQILTEADSAVSN